jgi:hypothetical protein
MPADLQDSLRDLLRAGLQLVAARTGGRFPTYPVARIDFSEPRTLAEVWYDVPAVASVIGKLAPDLDSLPEMAAAVDVVAAHGTLILPAVTDAAGRPIAPSDRILGKLLMEHLREFVRDYIQANATIEFQEDRFAEAYDVYQQLWHTRKVRREVIAPLPGFASAVEMIEFTPDLKLLPLTPELKTALCGASPFGSSLMPASEFANSHFRLSATYVTDSPQNSDSRSLVDIERAVLALRLLKAGDVGIRAYFDRLQIRLLQGGYTTAGSTGMWPGTEWGRRPYELALADVPTLLSLYEQLTRLERARRLTTLDTALRRFQLTYTRLADEDRLIDLTIALECTLLYGIRDELSYRLAMRGAALLAAERDPEETYRFLRSMYEARSAVVHEGKHLRDVAKNKEIGGRPYHEAVEELESIVRATLRALLAALERGESSLRQIADALDTQLVRSLGH